MPSLTILLVEPDETLRELVQRALRDAGHGVLGFSRAAGSAKLLEKQAADPSLALLSAGPDPDMDALVELLESGSPHCQKVWIAPPGDSELDRLAAARRPRGLLARADLGGEACRVADQVLRSRERGRALAGDATMLGESAVLREVLDLIERIAAGGATNVLITGESGTGKEVAARRLHLLGSRAHAPFVEVDCASIPSELLESELFGYEAGAFTDARRGKIGLLEMGQGGTVFLDEIGELGLGLQAKLLRVLDSRRLRRVGGREEIPLDIHLVAATNRDLPIEVREGRFRTDLFYRLDVVRIEMPPVRGRSGDAWLLSQAFFEEAARRLGRAGLRLAPSLARETERYPWPGNVREIRNHMERIVLLAPAEARVVDDLALPDDARTRAGGIAVDFSAGPVPWETIERKVIVEALQTARGNVSEAARLLGLGRGALRYRMSRYELDPIEDLSREAA